jgi:hypothetical protein
MSTHVCAVCRARYVSDVTELGPAIVGHAKKQLTSTDIVSPFVALHSSMRYAR